MSMMDEAKKLWPELDWIKDEDLREKTAKTWALALERSVLTAEDLNTIPFTLLVPDLKVTFMAHKRAVVHIARDAGEKMNEFFRQQNQLIELARNLKVASGDGGSGARLAEFQGRLKRNAITFRPVPGLALAIHEGGGRELPVTVCTDIEDRGFLLAFEEGVDEAFNQSPVAEAHRFSVGLSWRHVDPDLLYPQGAPGIGEEKCGTK